MPCFDLPRPSRVRRSSLLAQRPSASTTYLYAESSRHKLYETRQQHQHICPAGLDRSSKLGHPYSEVTHHILATLRTSSAKLITRMPGSSGHTQPQETVMSQADAQAHTVPAGRIRSYRAARGSAASSSGACPPPAYIQHTIVTGQLRRIWSNKLSGRNPVWRAKTFQEYRNATTARTHSYDGTAPCACATVSICCDAKSHAHTAAPNPRCHYDLLMSYLRVDHCVLPVRVRGRLRAGYKPAACLPNSIITQYLITAADKVWQATG
jgi:hypothetical protein